MTENYLNYLEEENMLQIFGDTFTLEIKVLRWFPNSQRNINKVLTLAYQHDYGYDIYGIAGRLLHDLKQEMDLSIRSGDKARANKLEKNIDYIKFWIDRKTESRKACLNS